ncbi:hypothetical protein ABE142_18010 [Paenibacillus alvei]|uniref:hypothetical protein n=1 Tax=Paenibacillus alvei TaxID=44250 RepID=UPI003D26B09D
MKQVEGSYAESSFFAYVVYDIVKVGIYLTDIIDVGCVERGQAIMRNWGWIGVLAVMLVLVSGCGGPKADATIFIMTSSSVPPEMTQALQDDLNKTFENKFTVQVVASPLYSIEKLFVEYAAGENSVMIIPEEDAKRMAPQGGHVPMDKYFDAKTYREGVYEGSVYEGKNERKGTFLFSLPAEQLPGLNKHGIKEKGLSVTIPSRTPDEARSVEIIKALAAEK